MTVNETKEILNFLRGCYPVFYHKITPQEAQNILTAWSVLFSDRYYTYDLVMDAVKKCVTGQLRVRDGVGTREVTDGGYRRFPPQPGVILESLKEEREHEQEIQRYAMARVNKRRLRAESMKGRGL